MNAQPWDFQKVQKVTERGKEGLFGKKVLGCNPLTGCVTLGKSLYLSDPQFPHLYGVGVAGPHIPSFPRGAVKSNESVDGGAPCQLGSSMSREWVMSLTNGYHY